MTEEFAGKSAEETIGLLLGLLPEGNMEGKIRSLFQYVPHAEIKLAICLMDLGDLNGAQYTSLAKTGKIWGAVQRDAQGHELRTAMLINRNGITSSWLTDFIIRHHHSLRRMLMGELGLNMQVELIEGIRKILLIDKICSETAFSLLMTDIDIHLPCDSYARITWRLSDGFFEMIDRILTTKRPSTLVMGAEERLRVVSEKMFGDDKLKRAAMKLFTEQELEEFAQLSMPGFQGYIAYSQQQVRTDPAEIAYLIKACIREHRRHIRNPVSAKEGWTISFEPEVNSTNGETAACRKWMIVT